MDYEGILEAAAPFLGKLHGEWTNWSPREVRCCQAKLYKDLLRSSEEDLWQFTNFLV